MVKKRAEKAEIPRVVKTWRIKPDIIKEIANLSKREKVAECEIIEAAVLGYKSFVTLK